MAGTERRRWLEELALPERSEVLGWVWACQAEAVVVLDGHGRVLDANASACRILDLERDEIVGVTTTDQRWDRIQRVEGGAMPPEELFGAPAGAEIVIAIRAPGRPELLARGRTERRRWESGEELILATFVDVTAELRAEREAVEARRTFERIADSVEEFLFTVRLDGERMTPVYASPGADRLLGAPVPPGVAPEVALFGALHPGDADAAHAAMRRSAAGEPVVGEFRLLVQDDRLRWIRVRTTPREEQGVTYLDGIVSDITAAHRHEVETARFRAIVEASHACIALLDSEWRLRWMNTAGQRLMALDPAEVPGLPFERLLARRAREAHLRTERGIVERDGLWTGESALQPVDPGRRPVHVEASIYRIGEPDTGRPLGLVLVANDVAELRRLAHEHEAIGNLATVVASGADVATVFDAAAREVARVLDADSGAVGELDDSGVQRRACWPEGSVSDQKLTAAVAAVADAARAGAAVHGVAIGREHHCLGAAVRVEGRPWGVIVACRETSAFAVEDERAVQRLADLVGTAVGLARAQEQLVEDAMTDGLTGLSNHRSFHEHLRDEVQRSLRYERPIALVLVDLDSFKEVNDRHGHQAGDQLLQAVARALQDMVRGTEVVARLGGDEFALLLPETDVDGAYATAERVRTTIEELPQAAREGVTVSAGVADLDQASSADELIRLADGALYWSKVHGRNRVSAYDPERVEALSAQERAERLARSHALGAVRVLARLIDLKDASTHRHSERVAELAVLLAEELAWAEDRCSMLRDAALVHDVGKVIVPDAVLSKPGALSADEYEQMKRHAPTGAQIAAEALNPEQATWIRQHHERPDGEGYPEGIGNEAITDGARILTLADCWDVMTSERPYKAAKEPEAALAECRALVARQFDGRVLDAFERLWGRGDIPIP